METASLGPSEPGKKVAGTSHVLQEHLLEAVHQDLSLHGCATPLGLCLDVRSGSSCERTPKGSQSVESVLSDRKLK